MGKHTGASGSDTGSEEPEALDETRSIKSSLEALIEEGFEFDGVFAFTKQYSMRDAPNPCLSIDGIGTIGLPLSQREARVIVETCSQEIPAAQLRFENPDWEPWLTDVAGTSAYEALSLEGATFSLRKLALRAAEYPQLEAQNAESAGELVVVLPSRFEGGQHELRHRDQIKTFNVASQSGHSTTLVAAHAGVEHSISDVSSGYCLFLVYDIVQPLARAPASLPEMHEPVQRLRRILISWKADLDQGPEHLACVLRHKYERDPTFSAASLIGADELLLCHLSPLAAELGFSLHIAHLDTSSSATCGVSDYDSEKEYDDEAFVDHPDWVENWTEVKQVVDLKGMPVRVPGFKRKWSHENEWSHENQWGRVFLCGSSIEALLETEPDEVHLERTVEHSGSRSRMWRRAAILIWPTDRRVERSICVGEIYEYAFHHLGDSHSATPTPDEARIIDQLIARCKISKERSEEKNEYGLFRERKKIEEEAANIRRAMGVLRQCADQWNDASLFLRALEACDVDKNVDILGSEALVSAYKAFGWISLVDFCNKTMKNDSSSGRRSALLACLTRLAAEENDAELEMWTKAQEEELLRTLGEVNAANIPWLVEVTASRGSQFFHHTLLPQLVGKNLNAKFWISFIKQLHQASLAVSALQSCVDQCARDLVDGLAAFPTQVIKDNYYNPRTDKNSSETLRVVRMCLDVGLAGLCSRIFTKMRDAARTGIFARDFPPWLYYAELTTPIMSCVESPSNDEQQRLDEIFRPFFQDVVRALLSGEMEAPNGSITPCPLTDKHKTLVIEAARKAGGVNFLQSLTRETFKGRDCETIVSLTDLVVTHFPRGQLQSDTDRAAHDKMTTSLVDIAVDTFDSPREDDASLSIHRVRPWQMIELIRLCFDLGMRSHCETVLIRFTKPPQGSDVAKHVSTTLGPLLPPLAQFLKTVDLDFTTKPFKKFSAAVVKSYAEFVVGEKPAAAVPSVAEIQAFGCTCPDCKELKDFFLNGRRETVSLARKQPIRTHLERELAVTQSWGTTWETIKQSSPYSLQVTKPENMVALSQWKSRCEEAKIVLASLGDATAQAEILGVDYARVNSRIHGTTAGDNTALGQVQKNSLKRAADRGENSGSSAKKTKNR